MRLPVFCLLCLLGIVAATDHNFNRDDYFTLEVSLRDIATNEIIPATPGNTELLSGYMYYPIQCPYDAEGHLCGGGGSCKMDYASARASCVCNPSTSDGTFSRHLSGLGGTSSPFKNINTGLAFGLEPMCMACDTGCPCDNFQFKGGSYAQATASTTGCEDGWDGLHKFCYTILDASSLGSAAASTMCDAAGADLPINILDKSELALAANLLPNSDATAWFKTTAVRRLTSDSSAVAATE
jgi:hypothetical protein